ncbi:DUF2809 domain-containing protein [Mucilaginibacter sp. OK098]|uniref:ribosomal maturation YjgA family protein n=1 Tax=Mucilaginibacter sp. OK098 TaxID=1855297 RepID=UPI000933B1B5|nr:DUF2809 domain-containing protein [Mucilaginibacter sp. OK098]
MRKSHLAYFTLILTIIILGLLSRHINGSPLFIGDILWGLMVYFIVRFMLINQSIKWVSIASLLFCYSIEFSQLYQATWINSIRHTVIGGLILGETFVWGDLLCYTVGVGIGMLVNRWLDKRGSGHPDLS